METYKLTQRGGIIIRTDGACIPFDPANTDYQAYLKWIDDGNVPLSSEEGNTPIAADAEPADEQ